MRRCPSQPFELSRFEDTLDLWDRGIMKTPEGALPPVSFESPGGDRTLVSALEVAS